MFKTIHYIKISYFSHLNADDPTSSIFRPPCSSLFSAAWGPTGHATVAALAQSRLSREANAMVTKLLNGQSMAYVSCVWDRSQTLKRRMLFLRQRPPLSVFHPFADHDDLYICRDWLAYIKKKGTQRRLILISTLFLRPIFSTRSSLQICRVMGRRRAFRV